MEAMLTLLDKSILIFFISTLKCNYTEHIKTAMKCPYHATTSITQRGFGNCNDFVKLYKKIDESDISVRQSTSTA